MNSININRPMQNENQNQSQQISNAAAVQQSQTPKSRGSRMPWIVLIIVVIIVLGVLGFFFRDKFKPATTDKLSGYQAVFLTNGQVYFGKLTGASDDYATLTDIYYLQVNQSLQSGQATTSSTQQPQLSLVKLGNELHGPVDLMHISRQQILFYEDLKADGKVAQAIKDYQANGSQTQSQAPATQTPAQAPTQQTPTATQTPTQSPTSH